MLTRKKSKHEKILNNQNIESSNNEIVSYKKVENSYVNNITIEKISTKHLIFLIMIIASIVPWIIILLRSKIFTSVSNFYGNFGPCKCDNYCKFTNSEKFSIIMRNSSNSSISNTYPPPSPGPNPDKAPNNMTNSTNSSISNAYPPPSPVPNQDPVAEDHPLPAQDKAANNSEANASIPPVPGPILENESKFNSMINYLSSLTIKEAIDLISKLNNIKGNVLKLLPDKFAQIYDAAMNFANDAGSLINVLKNLNLIN